MELLLLEEETACLYKLNEVQQLRMTLLVGIKRDCVFFLLKCSNNGFTLCL